MTFNNDNPEKKGAVVSTNIKSPNIDLIFNNFTSSTGHVISNPIRIGTIDNKTSYLRMVVYSIAEYKICHVNIFSEKEVIKDD